MSTRRAFAVLAALMLGAGVVGALLVPRAAAVFTDVTDSGPSTWQTAETFPRTWTALTAGRYHGCGIDAAGDGWCWGEGSGGRLGTGSSTSSSLPVRIAQPAGMETLVDIDSFHEHTCALATDGEIWCWGPMTQGQAGNGTSSLTTATPVQVTRPAGRAFVALSAGEAHTCAVADDQAAWCWGAGGNGQLGNGAFSQQDLPVEVVTTDMAGPVTRIAGGGWHTCAVSDDAAWCWGSRAQGGQLGDGSASGNAPAPVVVSTASGMTGAVARIHTGRAHTCAVEAGGPAWCWGSNEHGRLGDGTITHRSEPRAVLTSPVGLEMTTIVGGWYQTCAVDHTGKPWCWGSNDLGQLGDGTETTRHEPAAVDRTDMDGVITAMTTAEHHTCAVDADGGGWCWGSNGSGRLGIGTAGGRERTPQLIPQP